MPTLRLCAALLSCLCYFSCFSCFSCFSFLCLINPLHAGGGPESVIVVVNAQNSDSLHVANVYTALRQIPESNVIYLENIPEQNSISLEEFRQLILLPIFAQIKQRKLDAQIDYITYSAGFPTRVSFDRALVKKLRWVANPHASITGLTYLFQLSLSNGESFLNPQSNLYYRQTKTGAINPNVIQRAPDDALTAVYRFFQEKNTRNQQRKQDKTEKSAEDIQWETDNWNSTLTSLLALSTQYPQDNSLLYNLACAQAMCGHADEALETLSSCIEAGYANWQHCQKDSDLASIQKLEAFKVLIQRMKDIPVSVQDSIGFSSQYGFNQKGEIVAADKGIHYVISTMLGYTGERGNSIDEIAQYLSSAAQADHSQPSGSIYFPLNGDIRSSTREWAVRSAIKELQAIDIHAELLSGKLPQGKQDVMGAHVGTPWFEWEKSGSNLLPGAIGEHLTSWGADFGQKSQVKVSAWLRAGAAGTSGTVSEPYALAFKFPTAFLYLHYARGCSLGESFYQSVQSPYELLILGDALCQPWAPDAQIGVTGLPEDQALAAEVSLHVQSKLNIAQTAAFLNGRLCAIAQGAEALRFNTENLVPGHYQMRVVAVVDNAMRSRDGKNFAVRIGKQQEISTCTASEKDGIISVAFQAAENPKFAAFALMLNGRIIGRHANKAGTLSVERTRTGNGPISLRPVLLDSDQKPYYFGAALKL